MPVATATADQLAAMRRDAEEFQAYALGPAATAVLRRYVFWREIIRPQNIGPSQAAVSAALQSVGIVQIIQDNNAADVVAQQYAQTCAGLNAGSLELAHWSADEHQSELTLGIVQAGSVPKALGLWPIVPAIVIGVAAVGVWLVVNAWLSVRQLEAQTDALRAKTQAAVSAAVMKVGATDPQAAKALAAALERANAAASGVQPSLLDKLAGNITEFGEGIKDSSGMLLLLGAVWLLSRRRGS